MVEYVGKTLNDSGKVHITAGAVIDIHGRLSLIYGYTKINQMQDFDLYIVDVVQTYLDTCGGAMIDTCLAFGSCDFEEKTNTFVDSVKCIVVDENDDHHIKHIPTNGGVLADDRYIKKFLDGVGFMEEFREIDYVKKFVPFVMSAMTYNCSIDENGLFKVLTKVCVLFEEHTGFSNMKMYSSMSNENIIKEQYHEKSLLSKMVRKTVVVESKTTTYYICFNCNKQ